MRIVVLLEVAADLRVPPELDPRSGRVREDRLVREIDPAAARALDLGFELAAGDPEDEVVVVNLGPPENDRFLRDSLSRGCRRAVRVWDEEAAAARTAGKAAALAAAVQALAPELILAGDCGVIDAGGQLGVLVAARLGVPCVTRVGYLALAGLGRLAATRELERGFRERVEAPWPVVLTAAPAMAGQAEAPGRGASVTAGAKLAALEEEIEIWSLADLGLAPGIVRDADRPLEFGLPEPRHPRLHPVAPPDPALPAFDRILALIQGSVEHREGRVVRRPAEDVAQEVFEVLRDEGWLNHLLTGQDLRSPDDLR